MCVGRSEREREGERETGAEEERERDGGTERDRESVLGGVKERGRERETGAEGERERERESWEVPGGGDRKSSGLHHVEIVFIILIPKANNVGRCCLACLT